jgi:hypothetical protein
MGKEWMRRGRKSSWEGEQWDCHKRKGGKMKGVRIRLGK